MKITNEQQKQHDLCDKCCYCQEYVHDEPLMNKENAKNVSEFDRKSHNNSKKVRDHCHITGEFRGTACSACNLLARQPKTIPVAFHNLKGYDAHLILKDLNITDEKISLIPNTEDKYMTFTIRSAKFIDTCQFLSDSLSNLSDNLYDNGKGFDKLYHTKSLFKDYSVDDIKLIMKKIPYPYEWMTEERMSEKSPIAKENFYDSRRF
eukprot:Lithocolla_globosa_v1_NODE_2680_length_1908_cov_4.255262.p2 type:complete len:206 gc:universal NODE_2680_length_1908_cov_4.255262:1371-754(-)